MLFATTLAPDEQVAVLRAFLGDRAARVSSQQAESLCRSLEGVDEKVAAGKIREGLLAFGIALKHTHALNLVGKLAGRAGWHRAPVVGKGPYRFMAAGTDTQENADEFGDDPAHLLGNLCEMVVRYAKKLGRPSAPTLRRSAKGIFLSWMHGEPSGLLTFLQTEGDSIPDGWQAFLDAACERLRRVLEEGDLPCFCDGYVVATAKPLREHGKVEITVHHNSLELGRGNELLVLDRIEREVGGQLAAAVADINRIEVGKKAFYIGREYNAFEPLYSHEVRTFLHPETEELLRRYRRFAQRLRMPIGNSPLAERTKEAGHGIPQTIPVSWEAINARQNELKMQDAAVEQAMGRGTGDYRARAGTDWSI